MLDETTFLPLFELSTSIFSALEEIIVEFPGELEVSSLLEVTGSVSVAEVSFLALFCFNSALSLVWESSVFSLAPKIIVIFSISIIGSRLIFDKLLTNISNLLVAEFSSPLLLGSTLRNEN